MIDSEDRPTDEALAFRVSISASAADVDELGHVSNIAYVRWLQEAATRHSAAVGFGLADYLRLGGVFVVRTHEIEYFAPAFDGDAITLTTWVSYTRGARSYRRTRIERDDGTLLVRAGTLWAYLAHGTGRPTRIPDAVIKAFSVPASSTPEARIA
jgi:acyl-CoA thioester hydrolase